MLWALVSLFGEICSFVFNTVIMTMSVVACLSYRIERHLRELSVALLVARFETIGFLVSLLGTLYLLSDAYLSFSGSVRGLMSANHLLEGRRLVNLVSWPLQHWSLVVQNSASER